MALSDLISRPIAAPLEGFDKAVGVGFELAQKQDQLRIANEELKIKQQEIQDTFMTKGMNLMSVFPKLKTKKEKTFYLGLMRNYFEKSGFDKAKTESLFAQMEADEEFALGVTDRVSTLNSLYPPTSVENIQKQKLEWTKFQDLDEEQRKTQIESLNAQEKALLAQQTLSVTTREIEKRGFTQELTKSAAPMHVIERANQGDLGYANMWRMSNDRITQARTTLKDAKFISPEKRKDIETQLNRAAAMLMSPDSFQQGVVMSESALVRAGELQSESAKKEARKPAPVNIPKELSTIRKEANAALKDDIAAVRAADDIISLSDKSGAITAGMILGKMQILREGKVSVLREGEYDRALKEQGIIDRVNVLFERYGNKKGEALGPTARAEYKRLATDFKRAVLSAVGERSQPYLESARAFGASDDQIKKQIFSPQLHPYIFPKAKDLQKPAFFPTPAGEAPEAQAQQPKTTGKKRWSLKAYKQKNPNLTEDQYNRAKQMAAQSGREVIE